MRSLGQTICLLLFPVVVFSQTLSVHKIDGTVSNFTLNQIDSITFTTTQPFVCGTSQVTYSGKTYNTVQIGTQCWLKENLDVGTMIQGAQTQTNNSVIEKYCYANNPANCNTYGGLYQWAEAVQYRNGATNTTSPNPPFTGNTQGICPTGWHIPTLAEYETLKTTVGGKSNAIKAIGQGTGAGAGTNTSGFSALLAGSRDNNGNFNDLGISADFWSSTEFNTTLAYDVFLWYTDNHIYMINYLKNYGYSVRCVKD